MAFDAYINFGDETGVEDDDIPLIPGDSDDDAHFFWCEIRGCDFELEASEQSENEQETTHDQEGQKPRPELKSVTIKKRVDWASTTLFNKCCEAPEATAKKTDDEQGDQKGRIKQVTIEVCHQSGEKVTFLIIEYTGVKITRYAIDMSGPEPSETITFEAEMLESTYQQTDPYTGSQKDAAVKTGDIKSYAQSNQANQAAGVSATSTTSPAATVPGVAAAATAVVSTPGGNGSTPGVASTVEIAAAANFPGLRQGTGPGLLAG